MLNFAISIENGHVIHPEQAKISVITHGIRGTELNFSHKTREDVKAQLDLGETVLKVVEVTPGGVLLFFPSYAMLLQFYASWDEHGILKRMEKLKGIYTEPRDSSHYKYVISAFYKDVYGKGAVMFAVCRGKISEGLDFSDDAARCVMLIGIPYPMIMDPKTILKRHYLDQVRKSGLTGQ